MVGIDNFPAYLLLDRLARSGITQVREIQTDEVRTRCTYIAPIATLHPLYLARNSLSVDVINVITGELLSLVNTEMSDRQYFESAFMIEDKSDAIRVFFAEERKVDALEAIKYAGVTSFGALKYLEVSKN